MIMTRRDAVASFTLFAELIASSRDAEGADPGNQQPRPGRRYSSTICPI